MKRQPLRGTDELIVRVAHERGYTKISNAMLCDSSLSWKARGLLAYLLSKPNDWKVIASHLETQSDHDGKASVVAGLDELERACYMLRTPRPKTKGQYAGWIIHVFEEPYKNPDETKCDFQSENQVRFSATDNQPLLITDTQRTELQRKEEFQFVDVKHQARRLRGAIMPMLDSSVTS
jgi:hypothetical protein